MYMYMYFEAQNDIVLSRKINLIPIRENRVLINLPESC